MKVNPKNSLFLGLIISLIGMPLFAMQTGGSTSAGPVPAIRFSDLTTLLHYVEPPANIEKHLNEMLARLKQLESISQDTDFAKTIYYHVPEFIAAAKVAIFVQECEIQRLMNTNIIASVRNEDQLRRAHMNLSTMREFRKKIKTYIASKE